MGRYLPSGFESATRRLANSSCLARLGRLPFRMSLSRAMVPTLHKWLTDCSCGARTLCKTVRWRDEQGHVLARKISRWRNGHRHVLVRRAIVVVVIVFIVEFGGE